MEEVKRQFKGVWIPREIYLDNRLSWTQKILLVEIDSLDNEDGCYANNAYFAKFLSKEKMYISQCVSLLVDLKLVKVYNKDGKRILHSNLKMLYGDAPVEPPKKPAKAKGFVAPTLDEVQSYFAENGYTAKSAQTAFDYYTAGDWKDSKGNRVLNWKQKMRGVWFRDENKEAAMTGAGNGKFEGKLFRG